MNENKMMDNKAILEVFYVMEGRGIEPGSFTRHLIETIAKADATNKGKLALVYPEYVEVVSAYQNSAELYDEMVGQVFENIAENYGRNSD